MMGSESTYAVVRIAPLALLLLLVGPAARAGNGMHPRTPVLWPDAPCIQTVDPALEPTFTFSYAVPFDDTQLSVDELEDSRRHQFIAFCRQWPAGDPPPAYVSIADLERALETGVELDASLLDTAEATLETSLEWAGCWTRITADDARRPITHAAAAAPLEWDLAGVEAGTWMVAGYTWEPPLSIWRRAPWVLRVLPLDDQDPREAAAAIALTPEGVPPDDPLSIPVCVAAEPGSTLSLEWSSSKLDPLEWTLAQTLPVTSQAPLELGFDPSSAVPGDTLLFRVSLDQALGADYISHGLVRVSVFAPPLGGEDEGGTDEDGAENDGSSDAEDSSSSDDPDAQGSGSCSLAPSPPSPPLLALFLLALARRARPRIWTRP